MGIKLPIGIESFSELRTGGYYYAGKTQFTESVSAENNVRLKL